MATQLESKPAPLQPVPRREVALAVGNTFKLGLSLLVTWTVALLVRFHLPRQLGPASFGQFSFSEAFAASFFSVLSFGVGTYIQKEIAVRPGHASDFFGGVCLFRGVVSLLLLVAMAATLEVTGQPRELQLVVLVFGAAQFLMELNFSLAAMLQAVGKVNALAVVNVASKVVWGVGLAVALFTGAGLAALAVPYVIAEVVRAAVLFYEARHNLELRVSFDFAATKKVMLASLPFAANGIAVTIGSRIDLSMLKFLTVADEVGWYGAASNFASLAMLMSPVLSWVLMPMMARARHRSEDEFFFVLRRAIEAVLVLAVPVTLFIALGADLWVRVAFGREFVESATALRVLAPMFVVTYLAILFANALILVGKSWTLTTVSLVKLGLLPAAILGFVPLMSDLGPGLAGTGAAVAVVLVEIVLTTALGRAVGARAFDGRSVGALVKSLILAAGIVVMHLMTPNLGAIRLLYEVPLYVVGVLMIGAVRPKELRELVRMLVRRREYTD